MRYFFLIDGFQFHGAIVPALAEAWQTRSFAPACALCRELSPAATDFMPHSGSSTWEPLVQRLATTRIPFRRDLWRLLTGEILLLSAVELPELETPLATFACLLHQGVSENRGSFPPIQRAIEGCHDLMLGEAYYRPEHAGWNDLADVKRLAEWLKAIDPANWRADDLPEPTVAEREDELAFAREWFPALTRMYDRAAEHGWIIVSEAI